jgi:hypothetical protein
VAIAVAATALPYLSRPVHRLVWFGVAVAVLAAVCGGEALPVNAVSSVALGWGVAAGLHLAVGSPLGLPSAAEVTEWIADLHVAVADIARAPRQVWGVEQFTGRDPAGKAIELSVYGRDASDAGVLAKLWRFCVYRDSGATLISARVVTPRHKSADITGQATSAREGRLEEGQTTADDVGRPRAEAATWPAGAIRSLHAGPVSPSGLPSPCPDRGYGDDPRSDS